MSGNVNILLIPYNIVYSFELLERIVNKYYQLDNLTLL